MIFVERLKDQWKGQEAWVLGNGPSLNEVDLKGAVSLDRCIGVNRILACLDKAGLAGCAPSYVLSADVTPIQDFGAEIGQRLAWIVTCVHNIYVAEGLTTTKQTVVFAFDGGPRSQDRRIALLEDALRPETGPRPQPGRPVGSCFYYGYLSGYYAAEMAALLVGKGGRVVLAGMDLRYERGRPTHAYGDGKGEFGCTDARFPETIEAMCRMRENLKGEVEMVVAGSSALLDRGFAPWR